MLHGPSLLSRWFIGNINSDVSFDLMWMGMFSFEQCFEGLWEVKFQSAWTCHNTIRWFIGSRILMSPVCFSGSFSSFWSPELRSEVEFAETLLAGSLGLCLTMHNWALLLAYSHGCTLFSWNGQECNPPTPPSPLQPAFPGGPQSDSHKVYQTCLSEGAGLAWTQVKMAHVHQSGCKHMCTRGRSFINIGFNQFNLCKYGVLFCLLFIATVSSWVLRLLLLFLCIFAKSLYSFFSAILFPLSPKT